MKKIKDMISKNQCTGCCACIDICPQNAITVITDIDGFQIPQIAEEMCTHCDRCDKVCPVLHYENDHFIQPEVYAIRAFDTIRMQSSSGGVFSVIAQYILKEHGCCIGAGWDTATTVRHMVVYEQKELGRILGSKYMQSRMDGCMRIVKKLLETGRKVLFVGTPCQIAGLYGFLGKKYINLLTIDLLCHGVPSDQVIETYLQEMFGGGIKQRYVKSNFVKKNEDGVAVILILNWMTVFILEILIMTGLRKHIIIICACVTPVMNVNFVLFQEQAICRSVIFGKQIRVSS